MPKRTAVDSAVFAKKPLAFHRGPLASRAHRAGAHRPDDDGRVRSSKRADTRARGLVFRLQAQGAVERLPVRTSLRDRSAPHATEPARPSDLPRRKRTRSRSAFRADVRHPASGRRACFFTTLYIGKKTAFAGRRLRVRAGHGRARTRVRAGTRDGARRRTLTQEHGQTRAGPGARRQGTDARVKKPASSRIIRKGDGPFVRPSCSPYWKRKPKPQVRGV